MSRYNPTISEILGRGSVGEPGLTTLHKNVIFTIGGTITNVLGNATYGEVILPRINGYEGTSIFGSMVRPYFGKSSAGTHPIVANLFLAKPLAKYGSASIQYTAMLYIDAPMDEVVDGDNYAIWVDSGKCRFDGDVSVNGNTTLNGSMVFGGNITSSAGGPNSFSGKIDLKPSGVEKLLLTNTDWAAGSVGTQVKLSTSATSGNAYFSIQALNSGGNVAGKIAINPSGGNVGICGITAPTSKIHIAAGTTGAGTAPLKLTSGALNTIPEEGAIEFDGTNLYFTDSTGIRRTLAIVA